MKLTSVKNGIGIVEFSGRLDASNADKVKPTFQEFLSQTSMFVFDLTDLKFLDSTGLGVMVACLRFAKEREGRVTLCCIQAKPKMVFDITKASILFDIYDTQEEAVLSYST